MNKRTKLRIILGALVLSIFTSNANAGLFDFVKENPLAAAVGGAASVGLNLNKQSYQKIINDLADQPDQTNSFFQRSPNYFNPIANLLLKDLAQAQTQEEYSRYRVVADIMGLDNIPPFSGGVVNNGPTIHVNPQQAQNSKGNVLANYGSPTKFSNIIISPEGQKINPIIEYPNEVIHSWEDYLLAKQNSTELAQNMEAAGMGAKPAGYAAHHIVPATAPGAADARAILEKYLRPTTPTGEETFNNEINGVYLPTQNAPANNIGIEHNGRHPNDYVKKINDLIKAADQQGGEQSVRAELDRIRNVLRNTPRNTKWGNVL